MLETRCPPFQHQVQPKTIENLGKHAWLGQEKAFPKWLTADNKEKLVARVRQLKEEVGWVEEKDKGDEGKGGKGDKAKEKEKAKAENAGATSMPQC